MRKILLLFLLVSGFLYSYGQNKYTISGFIQDKNTGEKLINANVYNGYTYIGSISNYYGFYSVTFPEGKVKLTISYVGYKVFEKEIDLHENVSIDIDLDPSIEIEEVKIYGTRNSDKVKSTQMSAIEVPMREVKNLPVLLGEVDILKTIQLLPGVQSGNEGTSGIYVRGGGPDQNLILLDGVPIYNVNHLFGFFSVFNADAINNIKLVKGGFPARYGGRLSSVLDIRMKEGNMKELQGTASIGLISSKLSLEGPIIKDKTSFIVSGRRTYIDILAQPLIKATSDGVNAGYYFYDLNAKINHKFSNKSRLFLSTYLGEDKVYTDFEEKSVYYDEYYKEEFDFNLGWGNAIAALRWNYLFNDKLFSNSTLTFSRYRFKEDISISEESKFENRVTKNSFYQNYFSGIDDWAGKIDFDYYPGQNHNIKFGINDTYHTFKPGVSVFKLSDSEYDEKIDTTFGNKDIYANEFYAYFEDDMKITNRLKANLGLHYSNFNVNDTWYHSLQPRIAMTFLINEKFSIKASYAEMAQNLHLLSNSTIGLPTDLWLPATDRIKPQLSQQYAIGTAYAFNDMWSFSFEAYYKNMENLIAYKEGSSFFDLNKDWQDLVETGTGNSYGGEIFIQKSKGNLTGWVGYTLSWTNRKFENLNFGKEFPYRYDRRHDISIVGVYKLNEKIDLSATWVYGTGNAVTLALEKYPSSFGINSLMNYDQISDYETIEYYEARNNYRMAAYHRFDFGVNFHKDLKWGHRVLSIGVYNAYSRKNPFFLIWQSNYDWRGDRKTKELVQISLFPIIPSIRYSVEF